MTDNEIIKALELCFSEDFGKCELCPLKNQKDEVFTCIKSKQIFAIDLINRQNAEIERLNDRYEKLYLKYDDVINDNKFLKRKNNEQGAEIDMMRKYIHDNNLEFDLLSYSKRKDVE